jgi:uncharacterized protein YbdZ (MbtH family)
MSVHDTDADDTTVYKVVVNDEEQYSIWPDARENPLGWRSVGVNGSKADCLSHIEAVWTDMRPLSLRKAMEQAALDPPVDDPPAADDPPEDSLPVRLSRDAQPIEVPLRPEPTTESFVRQIESGYVHVRFTATRGGTELGFPLDAATVEQIKGQVARGESPVQVSGQLTLDYVPIRCVADIDLATFTGTGRVDILTA